jgi:hypothetical protein
MLLLMILVVAIAASTVIQQLHPHILRVAITSIDNIVATRSEEVHDPSRRILQTELFADATNTDTNTTSNNTNSPISSPSASMLLTPNDPIESNSDELINTTNLLLTDLSVAPSHSPSPTQSATTHFPTKINPTIIHTGPHFWDSISPPDLYAPDMYGYPRNYPPTLSPRVYDKNSEEDTDFKEFIAFVGWYAFLIVCCLLPTACAYHRRRRNARVMRESAENLQNRLEEIDRMGGLDRILEGTSGNAYGFRGEGLDLGENRSRDWEFLEQLFGSIGGGGGGNEAPPGSVLSRRRVIMSDILGGMSVRMLVEREERRKRERGRRLVAALKESSMVSDSCHCLLSIPQTSDSCRDIRRR